jgi:hypothetical protein
MNNVIFLVICILITQTLSNSPLLYEKKIFKYSEDDCDEKTGILFSYLINNSYILPSEYNYIKNFALYSGNNINDLGDYNNCIKMTNQSKYIYLSFTLSQKPLTNVSLGLCYFKECEVEYFQKAEKKFLGFVKNLLNLTDLADILFFDSKNENSAYRERYKLWFYIFASFFSIIIRNI